MHFASTDHANHTPEFTPTAPDGTRRASDRLPPVLIEYVDSALNEAFSRTYASDPVIGTDLIRILGPLDSIRRRHGILIERALAHALAVHPQFDVQTQVAVPVSRAAIDLCAANATAVTEHLALAVSETRARTVVLDLVVYDRDAQRLIVASVKRGSGMQGGTAAQDEHIEQRAAAMILRTMIASQGLPITRCDAIVIDWYGRSGIVGLPVVTGAQLDSYFGVPIFCVVDGMSGYLTSGVQRHAAKVLAELFPGEGLHGAAAPAELSVDPIAAQNDGPVSHKPTATVIDLEQCLSALPRRTRGRPMQAIRPSPVA